MSEEKTWREKQEEKRQKALEATPEQVKASQIRNELAGTIEQRMTEEKTIILTMVLGKQVDVRFSGFWNGRFLSAALKEIHRAYKHRKWNVLREAVKEKAKAQAEAETKAKTLANKEATNV